MSTDPARLATTWWLLTTVVGPDGSTEPASASVYFAFTKSAAFSSLGDSANADTSAGQITFETWVGSLVGGLGEHLNFHQSRQVFAILAGSLSWSIRGTELAIDHSGVGSLVFQEASDYRGRQMPSSVPIT